MQINPSPDCVRALTKMTGCPACQGLPELKACSNYCINVMKGCLAYQAELDGDWNNFVGGVFIISRRLICVALKTNVTFHKYDNILEVVQHFAASCVSAAIFSIRRKKKLNEDL